MEPGEPLFDAKVMVLKEYIKHHVKEEETEIFPTAKKLDLDFETMGDEMAARKEELMSEFIGPAAVPPQERERRPARPR
jgi:hemerythrin-like domain-containing protein